MLPVRPEVSTARINIQRADIKVRWTKPVQFLADPDIVHCVSLCREFDSTRTYTLPISFSCVSIGNRVSNSNSKSKAEASYQIVDFANIEGVPCPCGTAKRAFADNMQFPGTIHVTQISTEAKRHYHKKLTETYYVLECEPDAAIELDDQMHPVGVGTCVVIPPGVRHRAVGKMKVLIVVLPEFDSNDEWFD